MTPYLCLLISVSLFVFAAWPPGPVTIRHLYRPFRLLADPATTNRFMVWFWARASLVSFTWVVFRRYGILAVAALVLIAGLGPSAYAGDAVATVSVPIGDWIAQGSSTLASLCVAALSWAAARWLPSWIRMQLTEQLLARAVDYGLAVVAGAAKGKVLDIPIANQVLRAAASYAVANAPGTVKWLGRTLEPKLIARLSASGVLPEHADGINLGPA